jgi:hypothetical protein
VRSAGGTGRRLLGTGALALLAGACAAPAAGQGGAEAPAFSVGAQPDTVTIGDRFVAVVRVATPPGVQVELPPAPDSAAAVQPAGVRGEVGRDASGFTAAYPLVAWRTGELPSLSVPARVTYPDGRVATVSVVLHLPFVRSVLPADTALHQPRGPRDVLGPDWDPRWIVALVVLALLLLAPAAALLRRWLHRRVRRAGVPAGSPRAQALAALERARRMRLVETGEWKEFYSLTSGAVRGYLDALSPRWSADLTTGELMRTFTGPGAGAERVGRLAALLAEADAVKFAGVASTREAAERHWAAARDWVASFEPDERSEAGEAAARAEAAR